MSRSRLTGRSSALSGVKRRRALSKWRLLGQGPSRWWCRGRGVGAGRGRLAEVLEGGWSACRISGPPGANLGAVAEPVAVAIELAADVRPVPRIQSVSRRRRNRTGRGGVGALARFVASTCVARSPAPVRADFGAFVASGRADLHSCPRPWQRRQSIKRATHEAIDEDDRVNERQRVLRIAAIGEGDATCTPETGLASGRRFWPSPGRSPRMAALRGHTAVRDG